MGEMSGELFFKKAATLRPGMKDEAVSTSIKRDNKRSLLDIAIKIIGAVGDVNEKFGCFLVQLTYACKPGSR